MSFNDYIYWQTLQETGKTPEEIYEYEHPKVVRCRECKYCDKDSDRVTGQTVFICQRKNDENLWEKIKADDFCSYGERKL